MKKHYYLIYCLAILALTSGCKKEQDFVTLGAVINSPSKLYINDNRYPCWQEGDQVYINNDVYPITAPSGSSARIENVVAGNSYRAIFPANLVTRGTNINSTSSIPITLPAGQTYRMVDGHQQVDAPMGAYITSGTTLQFYNLCSVLRITIHNSLGNDVSLRSISVKANNAFLSGTGTATVDGTDASNISLSSTANHHVSLNFSGSDAATIATSGNGVYDIVIPEFTVDNVTITVYTTDGKYFELTKNNVALDHNTVTTVTVNVTSLSDVTAAELVDGLSFKNAIPKNATAVVFEYNSSVSSGTLLSTANSLLPIFGNLDGFVWRVSTNAMSINANPDCYNMFSPRHYNHYDLPILKTIDFGSGFNTENVANMSYMFFDCHSLTSLDLSNFNTENVTNMSYMFYDCHSLTSLDLSNFNTENVTNMNNMFIYCRNLTDLDISNFNTENVTIMGGMFRECSSLTSLDLSNFNTENVTDMVLLFGKCSSLISLDLSNFNTENVTNMQGMFDNCINLTSLNLSNFNTSNATSMQHMFYFCSSLTSLDISNFNTENVTNMNAMFQTCTSLTCLNLSNFNTENVVFMDYMFCNCPSLTSLDVSNFNTSNVTTMSGMFLGCSGLTSLNLSNFYTNSVNNMQHMFGACRNLVSLNLAHFDMSHLTYHNTTVDGVSRLLPGKYDMCNGLSTSSQQCTITCPSSVQIQLQSGTGLPTSEVTFTWVRP